jgi:hypothetical protein
LRRSDWDRERLTIRGAKGGRTVRYGGDALTAAVNAVLDLGKGKITTSAVWLLSSRYGSHYTTDGFRAISTNRVYRRRSVEVTSLPRKTP